jgi:hypothetical protein
MLEGREREHSRAAERSLIIECIIAIELSADLDSPKMPNHALQRTRPSHHCCNRGVSWAGSLSFGHSVFLRQLCESGREGRGSTSSGAAK